MTRLPDINFEIDGDTVFIEQGENYGDVFRIELHRSQIGLIALQLGIVPTLRSDHVRQDFDKLQEGRECNAEPLPGSTS